MSASAKAELRAVAAWLRDRAESWSRDALVLRSHNQLDDALIYEGIRDELRVCAAVVESKLVP